jgi:hypothetical protein
MLETAQFYDNWFTTYYIKMEQFGIYLKASPLDKYFNEIKFEIKEFTSLEKIEKEEAKQRLKKISEEQNKVIIKDNGTSILEEKIALHFNFFSGNCPRNHKQILKDTDFNKLIEWTVIYFENNFTVPKIEDPISIVNTNKTFVQLAFRYLFKEIHRNSNYPSSLFDFYKSVFKKYSTDKEDNFFAARNNDEVKKLMNIDY